MSRQMHLIAILSTGPTTHHHAMWRHPLTENRFLDPEWWARLGKTFEDAKFDAVFCGDSQIFYNDVTVRKGGQISFLDPMPVAMLLAQATKHLGIGITVSSSFFEAYGIARSLGTLDLLSGGRIAWNVVTSTSQEEARRYGLDLLSRNARYDRADEMLEACFKLWDSIDPEAFVLNKKTGEFMDASKLKSFEYNGKYIRTKGPLTVPPSPQGRPVIMQAGSSERGRQCAARWAEIIFTLQNSLPDMQAFYSDIKGRLPQYGRRESDCAILTSVDPIIGETENIAREKQAYINSLVDEELAVGLASMHLGVDLTGFAMDQPLEDINMETGSRGAFDIMLSASKAQGLTLGQACRLYATSELCPQLVGTPEQVADQMQDLFEKRGCDGFILTPVCAPGSFEDFTRSVVPILQERGLFRKEYPGTTLRASLAE
jgi:FMN-dependent oxidoreductase (nitrilotriacetate monooxygenase family)